MTARREVTAPAKVDIQMTPMIDIVFQLLAFFLMTFKVAAVEADFDLRLPRQEYSPDMIDGRAERIKVRLTAAPDGELAFLQIASGPPHSGRAAPSPYRVLGDLLSRKSAEARAAGQEEPEVELDADDALRYEHIVAAIEAVQGPTTSAASRSARKIRFTPRRP